MDDVEHVLTASTSLDLLFRQLENKDFIIGTIADLINTRVSVNYNKTRILSPMGLGVLDLALGKLVFDEAVKDNKAIVIDNFLN